MNRWRLHAHACVVVMAAGGCAMEPVDYEIKLPNGYLLARTDPTSVLIADRSDAIVVGPSVNQYAVIGDYVLGEVVPREPAAIPPGRRAIVGYFLLDTRTSEVRKGLGKDEWLSLLRGRGILEGPVLRKPPPRAVPANDPPPLGSG